MEGKTIFITGGAGFIANILIKKLIDDNKVIVYDNFHRDTLTESGFADHKNMTIINKFSLKIRHNIYYIFVFYNLKKS